MESLLRTEEIDLQLVELFVAISKSGTIAGAARRFNISPSLATRRLATLEKALEARLFQRTTRALHLTDAGRITLRWAEGTLGSYGDLRDELSLRDNTPQGRIRLAVSDYAASALLPDFLRRFMAKYPKVSLDIITSDHLVNPVQQEFDVAIHSGFVPALSLIGLPLKRVQRILCASPSYLRDSGAIESIADLERHRCLVHSPTENTEWWFEHSGAIVSHTVRQQLLIDSYVALVQFAIRGLGIARISQNVVRSYLKNGGLKEVLPEFRCVQADGHLPTMWLVYPNRQLPYRIRVFVSELREHLDEPTFVPLPVSVEPTSAAE